MATPTIIPGTIAEAMALIEATRKMLRRVNQKCRRRGIVGYDQTDEWLGDLLDVADQFPGLTPEGVVHVVEAIQDRQGANAQECMEVWRGSDARVLANVIGWLYYNGKPGERAGTGPRVAWRLVGRPKARQFAIFSTIGQFPQTLKLIDQWEAAGSPKVLA